MANTKKNNGGKGNPASTRIGNKNRIAKRMRSWEKNHRAKVIRIRENEEARALNDEYRARGELTPYEARQRARANRN
jgi:hypothetical protein